MTAAALANNLPILATPFDQSGTNSIEPTPTQMANGYIPNFDNVTAEGQNFLHKSTTTMLWLAQQLGIMLAFNPDPITGHSIVPARKGGVVVLRDSATGETMFYVAKADMAAGYIDPSTDPTNWANINFNAIATYISPYADAGGTADARTATYSSIIYPALQDGMRLSIDVLAPNLTVNPTFQPTLNGSVQTARTIVKIVNGAHVPLAPGDLLGICDLSYSISTLTWVLLNPATATHTPGQLIDFAGTTPPPGFLACPTVQTDISRTTYAALFAAIGTTWGIGDGVNTFGMPWYPIDYSSIQSNANVGTQSVGQVISHNHRALTLANAVSGTGGTPVRTDGTVWDSTVIENTGGPSNLAAGVRILKCVKF